MRICFIGDSLVNGTGDDECLGWTGRLCADARRRGCDVTHYNLGVRRNTTADIAARWEREAKARLSPEHDGRLIFSFGLNDCLEDARLSADQSTANAREFLSKASAWLPTLMIGPPPIGDGPVDERAERLSRRLQDLCEALAIPFLSPREHLATSETWLREIADGDGAHPNSGGYAILADLVTNWAPWRAWLNEAGAATAWP